jgi:hypothetical protein
MNSSVTSKLSCTSTAQDQYCPDEQQRNINTVLHTKSTRSVLS